MRHFLLVISALCLSTALIADEYTGHPYFAVQGGYGLSTMERRNVQTLGTEETHSSSLPTAHGSTIGESVGVHLDNQVRFELNHMRRSARKTSGHPNYLLIREHIGPAGILERYYDEKNIAKTKLEQDTYMLQAYYKFAKGFLGAEDLWSFAGAGVGAAKTKVSLVDVLGDGTVYPGYTKTKWSPAAAVMLGLSYDINRALALDAELKYTYTRAKTKETEDNHNVDALMGMRVNF